MLRFVILLYILTIVNCYPVINNCELKSRDSFKYSNDPIVRKLQEYIRIDSSGVENIEFIVDFWRRQAAELGVSFAVYRPDSLPICVLTLKGRKPNLPSIMLNHHGDVVPGAYEDQWTYPPFSGHIDKNGNMFGRGTQDTKSVGVQYVEAVRRLVADNVTLERTLHITVMPEFIVDFWRRQAAELGVSFAVYRPDSLPICVLTLKGRKPNLPSIMLNHHGDVVPGAYEDQWTYPPFSGHIDKNGNMFGRGTQDTKSVGVQYVEAVRRLVADNVTLERTLHITVMPDEETGGFRGMKPFIETEDFKSLNIGFVLDEGLTSTDDVLLLGFQDKRPFQVRFNVVGPGGHGSNFLTNGSTIEKVQHLIDTALEFRDEQTLIMKSTSKTDYGGYTTLNINMIEGGVAVNVIPKEISVVMDIRLATTANITDVQEMLESWLAELGDDSMMEFIRRDEVSPPTAVDDSNLYWVAMQDALHNRGFTVLPVVLPATSDVLVLRARLGIPAFSFSPRTNMISKMHDVDEYIPVDNLLKGIDIYYDLIKNLANVPHH